MARNRLRRVTAFVAVLVASGLLAAQAAAQPGRVGGLVRDEDGQALKGATVTAENPDFGSTSVTATTDERGRFSMIGLRPGQWRFVAQAPGHAPTAFEMPVRSAGTSNPPITFTLRKAGIIMGPLGSLTAKDLQADLNAADALFNQQKWDEAIAAYRAILSKAAVLSAINLQIGAAYRAKKDYASALTAYNELLKVDPRSEKATVAIAATQLEMGDSTAADETLTRAAESDMAGRDVFYALGELRLSQRRNDEAAQWFLKASSVDPSWGKPLYQLARLALDRGDRPGASKYLDEVLTVDPVSTEAAQARAELGRLK
jgi:TolA-binding protein